jgi:hypothetical protein
VRQDPRRGLRGGRRRRRRQRRRRRSAPMKAPVEDQWTSVPEHSGRVRPRRGYPQSAADDDVAFVAMPGAETAEPAPVCERVRVGECQAAERMRDRGRPRCMCACGSNSAKRSDNLFTRALLQTENHFDRNSCHAHERIHLSWRAGLQPAATSGRQHVLCSCISARQVRDVITTYVVAPP